MSIFGWSMPPGCSGTPYDDASAEDITALVAAIMPLPADITGIYWDEDGHVYEGHNYTVPADPERGLPEYQDHEDRRVLTVAWEDIEGDECAHNARRAAQAYAAHKGAA